MASDAPLLSALRDAPKVGRWYMVPVVRHPWHGVTDDWPVLGPLHHDAEIFNFPHLHYHVDARFLTYRQAEMALSGRRRGARLTRDEELAFVCTGYPLCNIDGPGLDKGRPLLKRLRCARHGVGTPLGVASGVGLPQLVKLERKYGRPAEPRRVKGGRLLCPHQKVDLSQFPVDKDGLVTCPLHGLKVRCGVAEGALL